MKMLTSTEPDHGVSIETFAEWLAHYIHFHPRSEEAIERLGARVPQFGRVRSHWEATIQDDVVAERQDRVVAFGKRFAEVRKRLRAEKPELESLGPSLRTVDVDHEPEAAAAPAQVAPTGEPLRLAAPAAHPVGSLELRGDAPQPPIAIAMAVAAFDPDATLDPRPATGPVLPFHGHLAPEQAAALARPLSSRPTSTGTEALPDEAELAAFIAPSKASASADLDGDETLMVPAPLVSVQSPGTSFGEKLTPIAVPDLSIDAYAKLQADLRTGDAHVAWLRVGVTSEAAKQALQARFFARFQADPGAQAEFQARLAAHLAKRGT